MQQSTPAVENWQRLRQLQQRAVKQACKQLVIGRGIGGHRTDDSDKLVESVGLEELKLKNLRTSDAKNILAKAAKCGIPHEK